MFYELDTKECLCKKLIQGAPYTEEKYGRFWVALEVSPLAREVLRSCKKMF